MEEQLCPVCGCSIVEDAHEKDGVKYCCEPCTTGNACECSCCAKVEEKQAE